MGEFRALIAEGAQGSLIDPEAAEDLLHEAEEVSKKADEGEFDKVAETLAKLREKIAERLRDDRIDPGFAGRLG